MTAPTHLGTGAAGPDGTTTSYLSGGTPWPSASAPAAVPVDILTESVDVVTVRSDRPQRWLPIVETWHQAQRHVGALTLDLAIAVAVASATTGSAHAGVFGAIVLLLAGLLFGVWKRRSTVEAQGISWFARPLLPTSGALFAALCLAWPWGVTRITAFLATLAVAGSLLLVRAALWIALGFARRGGRALHPTLLIGRPDQTAVVMHRIRTYPEAGLEVSATFSPGPEDGATLEGGRRLVDQLLGSTGIRHVVCVADHDSERVFRDVLRFADRRIDCSLVLPLGGLSSGQSRVRLGDIGLIPMRLAPSWGSRAAVRTLDIVGSLTLLILLSPLLAVTAMAVRAGDGGPAIFRQRRVGLHGKSFVLYKFRSMVPNAEGLRAELAEQNVGEGLLFKVNRDPRITPVGALIRRLSIDELPQLFNVLMGSMSLVGPRPLPVEPDEFDVRAQIRHATPPGITGLWQVLGANALGYDDMVDLDLTYVTSSSLGVDLQILLRTIPALLIRRAAY